MRNPFKRKAISGSAEVVTALESGWMPYAQLGGGQRQRIADVYNRAQSASYGWMYTNSPAVRTVIDVITRNVGQLDLRLYEEVSPADWRPAFDHPAAISLKYPNEQVSADKFRRELFKDYLIYDNAYALITPAPNSQVTLVRIPAHMVVVMGSTLFSVDNYRVWPQGAWSTAGSWGGGGTAVDFAPEQILHWHGEHPLDPRIGLSQLDTIRDVIAEDAALQQATVELANNGLQEPTWVFRPPDAPEWSPTASRNFEEDLRNRMRRRNERPIVLEEGMEMRSFGVTPRDAQMMQVRQWAIERVAALYGVPLGMVGLDPNVEAAQAEFYSDTLPPYCGDFTEMLDQRLLVRVYNDTEHHFELDLDDKLMSQDDRLRALTSATGRAVMLTNEARAKLNLPPVDGGDEIVTPLNVIVGEKPSTDVMPVQDPNAPPQDGSYRTDQPPPPLAPNTPKAVKAYEPMEPLPQLHPRRAAEMERQRRNIDVAQGILQEHYNRLGRSLRAKAAVDWNRWNSELSDSLDRALKQIVQNEGDIYTLRLAGDNFDMGQVQHYLKAMADGAATAINETIRSEVEQLGIDSALAHAPQHVASAGTSLGARATIWAREQAAVQSPGYEMRIKSWIADSDRHAQFDGQTVAIGDDWPAGFAPGTEPGCACSISVS